jgi:hypothetical protein
MKNYIKLLFLLAILIAFTSSSNALELSKIEESQWSRCAREGSLCSFGDRRIVRFGIEGKWKYIETNDQIRCVISVFGDPVPGQIKYCEVGGNSYPQRTNITNKNLQVNVFVFDDKKLLNIKKWTKNSVLDVLEKASELLDGRVKFEISEYKIIVDEKLYTAHSQNVLMNSFLLKNSEYGKISLGFSSPISNDSAGMAIQDSFITEFKPKLIIRSRLDDGSKEDVTELARIFLHELGHTLGFAHDGKLTAQPFNTDDWWFVDNAREFLSVFASWASLRNQTDKNSVSQFDCKVAGFEPDTNLYENLRTQAVDLNECASRCLLNHECVAIAQGTWNGASCLLFTRGAEIVKKRSYGNANTCWLKIENPK